MSEYAAYILCTAPRSGSTLLCTLLTSTGAAGHPRSYFHTPSLADWREGLGLPLPGPAPDLDNLAEIMDAAKRAGSAGTDLFGLRLQRGSFEFFAQQLDRLHPGRTRIADRFAVAFGRTRFIHLTRPDKLAQAISLVRARQGGLWHKAPDGTELERLSPARPPVYDRNLIAQTLAEVTTLDQEWVAWFDAEAITPLRVTYDDLAADPVATVAGLLADLGRDPAQADGIAPQVAKLADKTSQDWADRFRAGI
ncbi:Stf0 family sulfotransferase [Aestuariivita sp.]|jgi:LPS sulfotransferase NodH|uniref:Stf0 family sulfotransferase n=1 Tax=Aestuariivita sp. TaxID=1872407 RepID=UPI00216BEA0D|nr:Stf0 family sulfotransferase [Aestuariivita sp.]MCE8006257.1 sulfotransferase [Aestuariivita sp.]